MICELKTEEQRAAFLAAAGSAPTGRAVLGGSLAAYGGSRGNLVRFFVGEGPALLLQGRAARVCGPYDPEELGAFLHWMGARQLLAPAGGAAPTGWRQAGTQLCFAWPADVGYSAPGWAAGFVLDGQPPMREVAQLALPWAAPEEQENFYSWGCTLRAHGLAEVRALCTKEGALAATAGLYGIWQGEAYLAAVATALPWRGRGLAGGLVQMLAAEMQARGNRTVLLCRAPLADFYRRLGFVQLEDFCEYLPMD